LRIILKVCRACNLDVKTRLHTNHIVRSGSHLFGQALMASNMPYNVQTTNTSYDMEYYKLRQVPAGINLFVDNSTMMTTRKRGEARRGTAVTVMTTAMFEYWQEPIDYMITGRPTYRLLCVCVCVCVCVCMCMCVCVCAIGRVISRNLKLGVWTNV